jgi:HlyD family secretion protein
MRMRSLLLLSLVAGAACTEEAPVELYQAIPVGQRNIVVSVRAAGNVQPDTVVEVKSKASGEILDIQVETGQVVQRGALLVRVDQRTARNKLAQVEAELEVAKAGMTNSESRKRRSDELFQSQSITQEEHESAVLALANAKADVVRAEVAIENARIQMEDTDVRSPITGTLIEKNVERGQVISSPTSDVGGGTVLLKMADLTLVQVRTLVDETDVGKVRAGLRATVTVDAYPNQPFQGEVLKIEPQAETQQNVTMFPVLVRIENRGGLLKPGMNADVEIHVGQRDNVLAVPNSSLRTARDVASAAGVLGIDAERLAQLMAAADSVRDAARVAAAPAGDSAARPAAAKPATNTMTMGDRTIELPEGVTEAQVRALFRKRFQGGELSAAEQAIMAKITQAAGGGNRGGQNGRRPAGNDYQFGGNYIVFVKRPGGPTPVHVRTGLTDLDYSEIVSGLTVGDSIIVLPSASLLRSQEEFRNRVGQMTGGGTMGGLRQAPANGGGQTAAGAAPAGGQAAPAGGQATPAAGSGRPPGGGR